MLTQLTLTISMLSAGGLDTAEPDQSLHLQQFGAVAVQADQEIGEPEARGPRTPNRPPVRSPLRPPVRPITR